MGLKKNILYSGFLTTSLYIFQFITYPYVARVLGVTNIGICNYVQSIVQYFSLFSMLGIATLGVREIAKCNKNKEKLNETFSQLFTINLSFTLIVLGVYLIAIETIPQFIPYKRLLYIGASQILFGAFTVEWLFRGLEEFKYITIRTMIVRSMYVASVFLFVRNREDYISYFMIYSGMVITNGIINWSYASRFTKFTLQPVALVRRHIKPLLFLGSQMILTSLYTTYNVIYLGMTCGNTQVGYYTTATKIENIILALYSSFTLVMMPRISTMMATNSTENVKQMIQQSLNTLFAFVFPCIFFSEFYTEELVYLVAGAGYEGAIFPMRIVMPLMLIVGLEQILIVQILIPSRADKEVFINSVVGASCSIILNLLIVKTIGSIGSAIAWATSETAVMATAFYFVFKMKYQLSIIANVLKHLIGFIPILGCYYLISTLSCHSLFKFAIGLIGTLLYSHIALYYVIRNTTYSQGISFFLAKIKHK